MNRPLSDWVGRNRRIPVHPRMLMCARPAAFTAPSLILPPLVEHFAELLRHQGVLPKRSSVHMLVE
jgi:hypothetical protein